MLIEVTVRVKDEQTWEILTGGKARDLPRADAAPWIDLPEAYALAGEITKFRRGEAVAAPERIGDFLYACLLDGDLPGGDEITELALDFQGEAKALHGLPWELMHTPTGGYLALVPGRPIVVTRLVHTDKPIDVTPRQKPPTVLFAVGAELTDKRVRAGTEFMALMRELDGDADRIEAHLLDQASLTTLRDAAARLQPDVVHLIAHGQATNQATFLQLRDDEDAGQDKLAEPDHVFDALAHAGRLPALVVLSACDGAVVAGDKSASFAAALVERGIPAAIAMSGRITDQACRIFMRRFGTALIDGSTLLQALADGRRAAFWQQRPQSADWALPCLFLAAGTHADRVAVQGERERTAAGVLRTMSLLSAQGAFYGRREFFEHYAGLVSPHGANVLVVETKDQTGLGRQRLLKELGVQALRDGHLPCLIENLPGPAGEVLCTPRELGVRVLLWIRRMRAAMKLPPEVDSTLLTLLGGTPPQAEGNPVVAGALITAQINAVRKQAGDVDPGVVQAGIASDLHALVAAAVAAGWPGTGEHSRPLLLLRGVQTWGDLLGPLTGSLITADGLGPPELPVPVVATWRHGAGTDIVLKQWRDRSGSDPAYTFTEMERLSEDTGEDLLAYVWRMLQPLDAATRARAVTGDKYDGLWLTYARKLIEGLPYKLVQPVNIDAAGVIGVFNEELVEGDDVACMQEYAKHGMRP